MNRSRLEHLLQQIQDGEIPVASALERLKHFPYETLEFATLDHHRDLRQGFPEVIFCEGKTDGQVLSILQKMKTARTTPLLATRVSPPLAKKILKRFKRAEHNPAGRTVALRTAPIPRRSGEIALITAGASDVPIAEEAKATLEILGYRVTTLYDVGVAGLHRFLNQKEKVEKAAVLIVVAGMDGALPSVIGGIVPQPVIAVPTSVGYGASFGGISALLAMLNSCAVGLAVVNIDNGFGAASLAHRILSNRK